MSRLERNCTEKLEHPKIEPAINSIVKTRRKRYIFRDADEISGVSIFNKCNHCEFRYRIMCYKYQCCYVHAGEPRVSGIFKLVEE